MASWRLYVGPTVVYTQYEGFQGLVPCLAGALRGVSVCV